MLTSVLIIQLPLLFAKALTISESFFSSEGKTANTKLPTAAASRTGLCAARMPARAWSTALCLQQSIFAANSLSARPAARHWTTARERQQEPRQAIPHRLFPLCLKAEWTFWADSPFLRGKTAGVVADDCELKGGRCRLAVCNKAARGSTCFSTQSGKRRRPPPARGCLPGKHPPAQKVDLCYLWPPSCAITGLCGVHACNQEPPVLLLQWLQWGQAYFRTVIGV